MNPISIIVSTYNRKTLTGITLDSIMACKAKETEVWIIDDASTEYDLEWLQQFSPTVIRFEKNNGVGEIAKRKIQFGKNHSDFFICLDNDALVTPEFDVKSHEAYWRCVGNACFDNHSIFSPYRSAAHERRDGSLEYDVMKDIGGISMAMDRDTAQHLLDSIPVWDEKWDYKVSEQCICYAPRESWVQHLGCYEGGVNAPGNDKALNFIGWKK